MGSSSSMICMARILGAPVMDPPGKTARITSIGPDARSQPTLDRSHQVVNLGEAFNGQGIDHADSAVLTDSTQIVALEVDDHGELGPILGRPGQLLRQALIFLWAAAAGPRSLDGPGDHEAAPCLVERLGAGRNDRQVAPAQKGREWCRAHGAKPREKVERFDLLRAP